MPIPSQPVIPAITGKSPGLKGTGGETVNSTNADGVEGLFAQIAAQLKTLDPQAGDQMAPGLAQHADEQAALAETSIPEINPDPDIETEALDTLAAQLSDPVTAQADAAQRSAEIPANPQPPAARGDESARQAAPEPRATAIARLQTLLANKGVPVEKAVEALNNAALAHSAAVQATTRPDKPGLASQHEGFLQTVEQLEGGRPLLLPGMLDNGDARAIRDALKTSLFQAIQPSGKGVEQLSGESLQTSMRSSAADLVQATNGAQPRSDATGATAVKLDIPGNMQQPAWQQALAERVVFAAGRQIRQAELNIHPAELGPVQIRIEAGQDRAAIQMIAPHAETREALDAALPRLREMFSQQGMDLVRADVGQSFASPQGNSQDSGALATESDSEAFSQTGPDEPAVQHSRRADGLLDLYA